jgi:hypothetical protein
MTMKALFAVVLLLAGTIGASAQLYGSSGNRGSSVGLYGTGSNPNSHYVQPHINSQGNYTGGHYRTNPNNTQRDNFGTRGNVNPYTGSTGNRWGRY